MKKKGFTLVELLAVIVILAIIALIAIPLIGNVIEKAKIGALESSVNGLVESANMYYANNTIKGETVTETTFDFEDGEQVSDKKLEYKGKVYNGKLVLHANGEVAVCIDDEEHYAYKNKDADEIVSGNGTCLYDGTTGDFSSNNVITDLRGKTLVVTQIEKNGDNAIITIPEEGHYDGTSKISIPMSELNSNLGIKFTLLFLPSGSNLSQAFGLSELQFSDNKFKKMKLSNAVNTSGVYINNVKQSTNVGEFDLSDYVGQTLTIQFRSNVNTNGSIDIELS